MLRLRLTTDERTAVQALRTATRASARPNRTGSRWCAWPSAGWGAPAIAASAIQPGDGAPQPVLPRHRRGWPAPQAARRRRTLRGASRSRRRSARCSIRTAAPGPPPNWPWRWARNAGSRSVPARRASISGASPPATDSAYAAPQAGPDQGRAGEGGAQLAQKATAGRIRLVYLDDYWLQPQPAGGRATVGSGSASASASPTRILKDGGSTRSPPWSKARPRPPSIGSPSQAACALTIWSRFHLQAHQPVPVPTVIVLDNGSIHRRKDRALPSPTFGGAACTSISARLLAELNDIAKARLPRDQASPPAGAPLRHRPPPCSMPSPTPSQPMRRN